MVPLFPLEIPMVLKLVSNEEASYKFTIAVPETTHQKFKVWCALHNISMGKQITKLVDEFLSKEKS